MVWRVMGAFATGGARYNARFNLMIGTLKRGLPTLLRLFAGTLPIYLGFLFFGVVMFGDFATRFDGTVNGAIALFAVRRGARRCAVGLGRVGRLGTGHSWV